ncbi:hypothetical protein TELCIR_22218 [Teladorsagia circumcincta]|uniref:Uncharacterized protein n=1 Tax=Teladorsagia circumcincta TaxID=45464 RepID=A0A2G9TEJ9_TELCI|nr:hypothetical protein TELCIR_22218 [Teladorsagia circumcincta]
MRESDDQNTEGARLPTGENDEKRFVFQFNLLSPSLFSIHEEGSDVEKTMSIPNLVKALPNKDQEAWLDFIVEAAGVTDAIDMTEKKQTEIREKQTRGPDGTPLYFTKKNVTEILGDTEKRKIETFEKLDSLYTKAQPSGTGKCFTYCI